MNKKIELAFGVSLNQFDKDLIPKGYVGNVIQNDWNDDEVFL